MGNVCLRQLTDTDMKSSYLVSK